MVLKPYERGRAAMEAYLRWEEALDHGGPEPAHAPPRRARDAMSPEAFPLTVSTEWLAAHLGEPDLRVVDGTNYLPHLKRDAHAEYRQAHIPGAVFFAVDEIADTVVAAAPHAARRRTSSPRRSARSGSATAIAWSPTAARA